MNYLKEKYGERKRKLQRKLQQLTQIKPIYPTFANAHLIKDNQNETDKRKKREYLHFSEMVSMQPEKPLVYRITTVELFP